MMMVDHDGIKLMKVICDVDKHDVLLCIMSH